MKNINNNIFDEVFKKHGKKIQVFLRLSSVKGPNFDKFRNTGYTKVIQNPNFIQAMIRTISANSLIYRELGLTESGAVEVIIRNSDVNFIKLSNRIVINSNEYYVYNDAVGNRLQIFPVENFDYSKIIIFRKDK